MLEIKIMFLKENPLTNNNVIDASKCGVFKIVYRATDKHELSSDVTAVDVYESYITKYIKITVKEKSIVDNSNNSNNSDKVEKDKKY